MENNSSNGKIVKIILLFCFLFYSTLIYAAPSIDILDREKSQALPIPRSQPKIVVEESASPTSVDNTVQFTLNSLQIDGSTIFSEENLLSPYRSFLGTKISLGKLYTIVGEITKKYRDAGYLYSRAIIPAQEVNQSGANIRILVIEGYIESIEYTGDSRILNRFKSYFSPAERRILAKKPLHHKTYERYMLLMQDVPGLEIKSRLKRGTQTGGSILVVDVQAEFLEGSISWGNTGTESSGPGIGSASLSINTLPVIGAKTTVAYSQANDFKEYWSWQVTESYQMWNGLKFTGSYAYSDSPETDTDFARLFDYEQRSHTFNFGVSYPVIRSRDLNLSLGLNYDHRNSDADVLDERFTRDRLRTLSFNANLDFSDSLGGVTQIIPTLYRGLDIFDATDEALDSTNSLAPANFWKFGLYASRNQMLPKNFSVFAAIDSQFSDSSLSSYNRFYLGGSRFGRGYEPGIIEGDNGFAALLEPRWTYFLNDKTSLQLFAFVDWGAVWTSKSVWGSPDSETASSAGAGFRLAGHIGDERLPDFNLSAFIAQPLEGAGDNDADYPRFVVQVGITF